MTESHETMHAHQEGRRVFITLCRPEARNAQNQAFVDDLFDITGGLVGRDDFDVVAIRSSSADFSAGLDLKASLGGWRLDGASVERWEVALRRFETLDQLVVALIDGYCLGGGFQLALACDLRIATERAKLAIPAAREVGFLPGLGAWRLPRLVGIARAKALLLAGAFLSGGQAAQWGVVDQVVEVGGLEAAWEALVAPISPDTLASVGACKRIIDSALATDHATAMAEFREVQRRLLKDPAALERVIEQFRNGERPARRVGWFPFEDDA